MRQYYKYIWKKDWIILAGIYWSKLTMETPKEFIKSVSELTVKTPEQRH